MSLDYQVLLIDPIYDAMGIAAQLVTVDGISADLTVLNRTDGEMLDLGKLTPGMQFATTKPAAIVRVSELTENGLTREAMKKARLTFNGKDWRISATQPKPARSGLGQLILILEDYA